LYSIAEDEDKILQNIFFAGKNDEYIVCAANDMANVYDSKTGKEVKEITYTDTSTGGCFINQQEGIFCVYDDNGFDVFDMSTLEKVKKIDEHGDIKIDEGIFSIGKDEFAIGNTTSGCLAVYPLVKDYDAKGPTLSIPIRAAYISRIFYSSDESRIFVVYKDAKTEVYSTKDLALQFTFDNLSFMAKSAIVINEQGDYILAGSEGGNMCDKDNEILAYFDGYKGYNQTENEIMSTAFGNLYSIPVYTTDMLLEDGKKAVK